MKHLLKLLLIISLPLLAGMSCEKQDINISDNCIIGIIPNDTLYKQIYDECYLNLFWIEVLNRENLGTDVKIYTPSPALTPVPPKEYVNVIEVPMPDELLQSNRKDTLLGKRIYFQYREVTDSEKKSLWNEECEDLYTTYKIPTVFLTSFSFSVCPQPIEN